MKIAILGYSGSGKSTLAKCLANHYGIPVLYLDTVNFEAGWKERDREEARLRTAEFMRQKSWVIDGNYSSLLQSERLQQADQIIFLTFSRFSCLARAFRRYCRYKNTVRESMAEGCGEKLDPAFIWWILYQGRRKKIRRRNAGLIQKYRDKTIVLKNQRQLDQFMTGLFEKGSLAVQKASCAAPPPKEKSPSA